MSYSTYNLSYFCIFYYFKASGEIIIRSISSLNRKGYLPYTSSVKRPRSRCHKRHRPSGSTSRRHHPEWSEAESNESGDASLRMTRANKRGAKGENVCRILRRQNSNGLPLGAVLWTPFLGKQERCENNLDNFSFLLYNNMKL